MGLMPASAWLRQAETTLPLVADPLAALGGAVPALVLAPHPDDESLGCGGLIAALVAAGAPPWVAVLTDGTGSHPGSAAYPPERLAALRRAEVRDALAALGLPRDRLLFLGLPDGDVARHVAWAGDRLHGLLAPERPRAILATWRHDPHTDHAACAGIALRMAGGVPVYSYPVWGLGFAHPIPGFPMPPEPWPEAPPAGVRLDIRAQLPAKRRAIAAHASQVTRMIDDVEGFVLPRELLALADRPFELILRTA